MGEGRTLIVTPLGGPCATRAGRKMETSNGAETRCAIAVVEQDDFEPVDAFMPIASPKEWEYAMRNRSIAAFFAVLTFAGCATTTRRVAAYRNPATQDVQQCEQATPYRWFGLFRIGEYAECKDRLERAGYVRVNGAGAQQTGPATPPSSPPIVQPPPPPATAPVVNAPAQPAQVVARPKVQPDITSVWLTETAWDGTYRSYRVSIRFAD